MPYYEITPDRPDAIPQATARIQAVGKELRDEIRALIAEAVDEGRRVAEQEAPRGEERFHEGGRIRDAIRVSEVRYAPGGAGGGGFYEADLYASSDIAPQVRFVMEGTADEGRGLITPAHGNVFPIEKEGEGIRYRSWVHGQRPQTAWWDHAREATRHYIEAGLDSIQ